MLITLAYNHKDAIQTVRLLMWIRFLWKCAGTFSAIKPQLMLIPSRHVVQKGLQEQIESLAKETFFDLIVALPPTEHEVGWPGAPNHMFKFALEEAERRGQDMFWLEPDAIPIVPFWLHQLKDEFMDLSSGENKAFMGGFVTSHCPHMTGVGFYRRDWRKFAPLLAEAPDSQAWDTYAAEQVVPHAHFTKAIQHVFYGPRITSLDVLDAGTLLFHQDKTGALIKLLDERHYGGRCDQLYGYSKIKEPVMEVRCFHTDNANRKIKAQGFEFSFTPYAQVGGAWKGLIATEDESQIIALQSLVAEPRSGVTEITEQEFESLGKKKLLKSSVSKDSIVPPPSPESRIAKVQGVVVEGKTSSNPADGPVTIADIDDVIQIGTVKPPDGPSLKVRPKVNRKPKTKNKNS